MKLNYDHIEAPEDFHLTFIGDIHSTEFSTPDYLGALIASHDVIFLEEINFEKKDLRTYQGVANGEYSALVKVQEDLNYNRQNAPGQVGWIEKLMHELYGSNLRVTVADCPKDHPQAKAIRKSYDGDKFLNPDSYPLHLLRDQVMMERIAGAVKEWRKYVKGFSSIKPLRGLAVMGAGHYVIAEGLEEAARRQGVTSFSLSTMFTSAVREMSKEPGWEKWIDYQNWVREPWD